MLEKYLKNPKNLVVPGVFLAVILLGWFLSSSASKSKARYRQEFIQKEQEVINQKRRSHEIPSKEKLEWLKERDKSLAVIFNDSIFSLKARQKEISPLRPLEFKEVLLEYQQKLETMPGGYDFPRGFGFPEYLDVEVPREEHLQELTKELYILYEVMRLLCKNNIDKINRIERRGEEKEFFRKSGNKERFFKAFSVEFEAESDFLNFMEAFREMAYSKDYFFIIDNLDFEKVGREKVKAKFIIRNIEFL